MKKVLFIVPYPREGASSRLRVEQYLPFLQENGFSYCIRPFVGRRFYSILYARGYTLRKTLYFVWAIFNRFLDIFRALRYDLIFIHRESLPIGSALIESIFKLFRKKIIFDFDDAIFLANTSKSNNYIERFKNPGKISKIIRMSDCIIAGNRYLKEYANKFNERVIIIPTPIDTDTYTVGVARQPKGDVTIGWIGSFTTRVYLNDIMQVFQSLKTKYTNLRFKFIGNWQDLISRIEGIEYKEWSLENELADIRSLDIGIMPMPDDIWTKGKCAFKLILYMACGLPVVASGVGANMEVIKNGVNGFLADSEAEWITSLSRLIDDPDLRKRIGAAGRETVEKDYSVKHMAPRFIETLLTVYDEGRIS